MQFRCSTFFVADVPRAVAFYEQAFGFVVHMLDPNHIYAELETGNTRLSFLSESFLTKTKVLGELTPRLNRPDIEPAGAMLVLVADDLERDFSRAIAAGATVIMKPERKPWGETMGILRDVNGLIIELCERQAPG